MRLISLGGCAIALVASVGIATPDLASAFGVVPTSLSFEFEAGGETASGTIDFQGVETAIPAGGVVLLGSPEPGDVTLVFTISSDAGSSTVLQVSSISLSPLRPPFPFESYVPTGDGTVPGPGVDVGFDSVPGYFTFPDGIGPGETSDPFFASFTPSDVEVGDLILFEFVVFDLGTVTIVPEPGALLLHALGLAALAGSSRRRAHAVRP